VVGHYKITQGRKWTRLQVCEARSHTFSYAGASRYSVRLLSEGHMLDTLLVMV
jgi:hypothetical protein